MTHLIFGSTGLIGSHLSEMIPHEHLVITVTRKPLSLKHPHHLNIVSDLSETSLSELKFSQPIDVVYCCIGTTIKVAGSSENFYRIDHDLVVNIAKLSNRLKSKKLFIVSAMGSNQHSLIFYNRVKGEMERDVVHETSEVSEVVFLRPSLLLGDRNRLQQQKRIGESIGVLLAPVLERILVGFLKKYRPVLAEKIAIKMLREAQDQSPKPHLRILENSDYFTN